MAEFTFAHIDVLGVLCVDAETEEDAMDVLEKLVREDYPHTDLHDWDMY